MFRIPSLFDVGRKHDADPVQRDRRFVAEVAEFLLEVDLFADQLAVFE